MAKSKKEENLLNDLNKKVLGFGNTTPVAATPEESKVAAPKGRKKKIFTLSKAMSDKIERMAFWEKVDQSNIAEIAFERYFEGRKEYAPIPADGVHPGLSNL